MNIQQRVQDILNRFDVNLTVTEEKSTELAEVTLENGTVLYADDEFAVGAEAYIINDEGERISVPAGDYELNDGRLLVIGEGGKVEEIKGAPEAEEAAEEKDEERVEQSADTEEPAEAEAEEEAELEVEIELEDKEEDEEKMYVTRTEVEEMIRAAFEALKEDEDKEEMSDVNPEAPKVEKPEAETEAQEAPEADPVAEELAAVKAELSEMKDEAVPMLKHATPSEPAQPIDIKKLSLQERVAVLHSKFSQK